MQNSVFRCCRRQPIPLYSNPPFSPSQGGPDSDGYSSKFPAARIGTDPPLLGDMPAQPRIERHGLATLENNPSSRVPKSWGKLHHKSKSGLGGKNILNTTSGAPVTMVRFDTIKWYGIADNFTRAVIRHPHRSEQQLQMTMSVTNVPSKGPVSPLSMRMTWSGLKAR